MRTKWIEKNTQKRNKIINKPNRMKHVSFNFFSFYENINITKMK